MGDDAFYEVEKILNHRKKPSGNGFEYFLKWKNYPDSENSWEPEEHVTDDLILPYRMAIQAKSRRKSSTGKVTPKFDPKPTRPGPASTKGTRGSVRTPTVLPTPPPRSSRSGVTESEDDSVRSRKIRKVSPEPSGIAEEQSKSTDKEEDRVEQIFTGLTPDHIDGICYIKKRYHFKVHWKNDPMIDLIPMKICNKLFPQTVIKYYEQNLSFLAHSSNNSK